ncbi:hypothetical protein LZ30DRAFT_336633 [Colletotrichum cereale]|nr:hypothetical protein LZ30DRAFT_336633 [Colletotrichum cereale]
MLRGLRNPTFLPLHSASNNVIARECLLSHPTSRCANRPFRQIKGLVAFHAKLPASLGTVSEACRYALYVLAPSFSACFLLFSKRSGAGILACAASIAAINSRVEDRGSRFCCAYGQYTDSIPDSNLSTAGPSTTIRYPTESRNQLPSRSCPKWPYQAWSVSNSHANIIHEPCLARCSQCCLQIAPAASPFGCYCRWFCGSSLG